MDRVKRIWYLLPMRAAKVQASLRIRAVSPEPPLLAHTSSESRGTFRQKARSLATLNGWACAVKIYNDGMLEDTNSFDGAHMSVFMLVLILIFIPNAKHFKLHVKLLEQHKTIHKCINGFWNSLISTYFSLLLGLSSLSCLLFKWRLSIWFESPVIYYWPFQGDVSVEVYSTCHCSSAFCLSHRQQ